MAASIWIQTSAVKKCEHCKGKAGTFGIAGEYIRGKCRRLFGFCSVCVYVAARENLKDAVFHSNPRPTVSIRSGYVGDEAKALKAAFEEALL